MLSSRQQNFEVLTVEEAAKVLNVDKVVILGLLESGRLPGFNLPDGDWRLKKDRLMDLLDGVCASEQTVCKVGAFIQQSFQRLLSNALLSEDELLRLQDASYCKTTFGVNYPVLRSVDSTFPVAQQRLVRSYPRYWNKVFTGGFLVTSEWYERHRQRFMVWVDPYLSGNGG